MSEANIRKAYDLAESTVRLWREAEDFQPQTDFDALAKTGLEAIARDHVQMFNTMLRDELEFERKWGVPHESPKVSS